MFRKSLLFFSFCLLISLRAAPVSTAIAHWQKPDTSKKQLNIQKTIAAKKDSISKLGKILKAIIKPFRFRANEEARIRKIVEEYLKKDTVNLSLQISKLKAQMPPNESAKLDSLMKEIADMKLGIQVLQKNIVEKGKTPSAPVIGKDTAGNKPAPTAQASLDAGNLAAEAAARQKMSKVIFPLLAGPQPIGDDTTSHKDTILSREQCIDHRAKVFGFYNEDSKDRIDGDYFKLITTFVYSSSLEGGAAPNLGPNYYTIDSARRWGCEILYSVYNTRAASIANLMGSSSAQSALIKRVIAAAARMKASGINIDFTGLTQSQRGNFVIFVDSLWRACRATPKQYYISVTMPGDDKGVAYDLSSLNRMVRYFIMDFSRSSGKPGPLAPLNDNTGNSIQNCFSVYLSWNPYIAPAKFVLGVPYHGVQWLNAPKAAPQYLTYQQVRNRYPDSAASYEPGLSAAYINVSYKKTSADIWYDDDLTLGAKYDFALNSALGGVAIKYLGADGITGNLKQELAYKMIKIDTSITAIHISAKARKPSLADFFTFLIESPCTTLGTPEHEGNHRFYSNLLFWLNVVVIAVMLIVAAFRFYKIKKLSSSWTYKQLATYTLIGLASLESILLLMFLFVWKGNPYFGDTHSGDCIDVPFIVLFLILVVGTAAGIILRWLYQLNYKNDRP